MKQAISIEHVKHLAAACSDSALLSYNDRVTDSQP